jgi:hypothetical protein
MKKLFVLLFAILLFSCEEPNSPVFEKTGRIGVFGNEPFAKIGICSNAETFLLDCDKTTETQLLNKQGCIVTVQYSECYEDWEGKHLIVEKIIFL